MDNTINNEVAELPLTYACENFRSKFKTEKEFTANLLPKLHQIIKAMYDLDVATIELEKSFKLNDVGLYSIKADIYITTVQGQDILIECKNPKHDKSETFNAFGQIMSYQYLLSKTHSNAIIVLATSSIDYFYFDFMLDFNLKFDVIINNESKTAFYINILK